MMLIHRNCSHLCVLAKIGRRKLLLDGLYVICANYIFLGHHTLTDESRNTQLEYSEYISSFWSSIQEKSVHKVAEETAVENVNLIRLLTSVHLHRNLY